MAHRIKFYADTDKVTNRFFVFFTNSRAGVMPALGRFKKSGMKIRAAWYENTNLHNNEKIDLWNL